MTHGPTPADNAMLRTGLGLGDVTLLAAAALAFDAARGGVPESGD